MPLMLWDIFCRVIDNHGDIGVAWRLSADLAGRGHSVRLWVDDSSALSWMAPHGQAGVQLVRWTRPTPDLTPSDVVVEAFGCYPPQHFVASMAGRARTPVWINLEHLSAESFAQRSHGLPSPVTVAPGEILSKRFYFPGFTQGTGGLLREPGLMQARSSFDRVCWLHELGAVSAIGEQLVSLFCYVNPCLPALLEALSATPTLLMVTPGAPAQQVTELLGPTLRRGALRVHLLPYLSQPDYDRLLWACDLNFVRGEDSFVRAQWAAKPFVWQIYPQHDHAHAAKLDAFLCLFLAGADNALARPMRQLWLAWNDLGPLGVTLPDLMAWQAMCDRWRDEQAKPADLVTQLLAFVS
jgi:uncharacterized repeat protein (TIGR03837 family)